MCSFHLHLLCTVTVFNSGLPKAVEISHKNMNSQLESINVSGKFKDILKEESVEHAAIVSVNISGNMLSIARI